jgi:uncharacterized cupredoxin-like copper-binding protein
MNSRISLIAFASLLLVGCASSKPAHDLRVTRSSSGAVTVPVELDDYVIRMPDPVPSGEVTFDVKNVGHHAHTIRLRGPGDVDARLEPDLKPGEQGTLTTRLDPGTYKVTCPVGPHAMLGMKRDLTVEK